ncbi:hypothetical protein [Cohnella nanjingensis]|uniref:WD40 repeat domain-containing protein n=1 Tax=Cohnella nanjingensis TaxID=1387779 RepID=A0A7X0RQ47_9BACL|nr:hypothetical protein [Cohnella nanjingensis]MBB6671652.1 hypothetical protein [Cohnella nanjingensis]
MKSNLWAGIPETHIRFVKLPNERGHNAVWDFKRSPDGRFYLSICGENEKPLTALLYEYDPATGGLRLIFDVAKVWIIDPEQMPPSKIHTSIDFLPDGRLIMATHNTAPAPGHKQWMFEQHYEHPWEGYPGSILMIVDPDTNAVQVRGIPVPRESIYGGMLGRDPRYYYFLGYMRGHFYRLDLETNEVRDFGKVSEFSSCRLAKDDKGRLYGSSYTGGLWRYDPDTDEIEDLRDRFRSPNGTKHRRQFIFALHSPRSTLFLADNLDGEMLELHPETLEVTRHGPIHLPEQRLANAYGIGGLEADEQFVLYYGLKTYEADYCPIRLVRWDILNGGLPENLGLVSPGGKDSQYICEMIFGPDGWLHMVDVCGAFSPYIVAVDVKSLRPPEEDAPSLALAPYAEPDWNGVGRAAFMHIEADAVRTLPLHQHMDWRDTAVAHMRAWKGTTYAIGGDRQVTLTAFDAAGEEPLRMAVVYGGGGPVSCIDAGDRCAAVLTADGRLAVIDLEDGNCVSCKPVPDGVRLTKLHDAQGGGGDLLASDREGTLYVWDVYADRGQLRPLENIRLATEDSHVVRLENRRLLLSGRDDELIVYDIGLMRAEKLSVQAASIRGRAFRAALTGGAVLEGGTVVLGTHDGMLFTLSPDLRQRTVYGRLYASGQLRGFVKRNGREVLGIYGGARDAGHVFHFSQDRGFVDWGRPRVIKDNDELRDIETEWAHIHYLSCLAYSEADDWLSVASGERYGCIVRYRGMRGI